MEKGIDIMIIDRLEATKNKKIAVDIQRYEDATNQRDKERSIDLEIYSILSGEVGEDNVINPIDVIEYINEYLLEKYGLTMANSSELLLTLIRQIKLGKILENE